MKKNILALFVLCTVLLTACSKNDNFWMQYVVSTGVSDTSADKEQNISQCFQLYKDKMYTIDTEWMKQIDLKTKRQTSRTKKLGDYFYIADNSIYFLDYRDEPCVSVCSLTDIDNGKSEIYWNNISSMLMLNEKMTGLRIDEKFSTILSYDGKEEEVVFQFGTGTGVSNMENLAGYFDGTYYLTDDTGRNIFKVNQSIKKPERIFSIEEEAPYTFSILKVRYLAGHLYILGVVINTEISDIGGPHYVNDAKNTGVWDISLEKEETRKIFSTLFDDIYVFDGKLYGINQNDYSWEILK